MLRDRAYFDATYLQHADDLRGVAHVVEEMITVLLDDDRLKDVYLIATAGNCRRRALAHAARGAERR